MYNIELLMINVKTGEFSHKETITMYSLWGARNWARHVMSCIDIVHADIIDTETGEVMLSLSEAGVEWDSEG